MEKTHVCRHTRYIGIAVVIIIVLLVIIEQAVSYTTTESHTHVQTAQKADMLLKANRSQGVSRTVLIASPEETLTLNGSRSFTKYRDNFDMILEVSKKNPENFVPFCTVSPLDDDMLDYIKECVQRGGKGIKLYNGLSYYYDIFRTKLNSAKMMELYAFAEKNNLPLLFHVNITKYEDQLRDILDSYPKLTVSIPHFMVSSIYLDRVMKLLDDYPNLYTDISFGSPEFMASGFRRLVNDIEKYGNFFNKYSDRILFGADMVLTEVQYKNQEYMEEILACYSNLLTSKSFSCSAVSDYYVSQLKMQLRKIEKCRPQTSDYCEKESLRVVKYEGWVRDTEKMSGFHLSKPVLKKIFETNQARWLSANRK